jgi:predicted nucleotidyltransferase
MARNDEVTVLKAERRFTLDELVRLAVPHLEAVGAERAFVFGSWARGTADGYSDVDLLVILDTDRPYVERWSLLQGLLDALPVPVDLMVYTPAEFASGMSRRIGIFDAVDREGVEIHARR